ncbi:hypothetical protein [Parapedobacter sp. DT-150]|uniref:hypothetical protein n=1 Tax=Parapedobacter sp. DT-150 TaxID=3396162 RepID=UPI003F1B7B3A
MITILLAASCTERTNTGAGQAEQGQMKDMSTAPVIVSATSDQVPRTVEDIQRTYAAIVAQKERGTLDSASFKYSCYNEKSGTVSYFSEKGRLRMIVHRYNEYDHHSAVDYYFVQDSTLFFVYLNRVSWAFESGPEGSTKDNITERRIYLVDQKPIRCLEKKFVVRSEVANNPRSESVANKEVNCTPSDSVNQPFWILAKYHNRNPPDCLKDG